MRATVLRQRTEQTAQAQRPRRYPKGMGDGQAWPAQISRFSTRPSRKMIKSFSEQIGYLRGGADRD